jgi:hypothetical protein
MVGHTNTTNPPSNPPSKQTNKQTHTQTSPLVSSPNQPIPPFPPPTAHTHTGEPVSKTDMWDFDGYRRQRHRFEHSHLTTGMWATTGACVTVLQSYSRWVFSALVFLKHKEQRTRTRVDGGERVGYACTHPLCASVQRTELT